MAVKRIEFHPRIAFLEEEKIARDPAIRSQAFNQIAKVLGAIEAYKPGEYDVTTPEERNRGIENKLTVYSNGTGRILRIRPNVDQIEDWINSQHRQLLDEVRNSPDSDADFSGFIWAITLWTKEKTAYADHIESIFRHFMVNKIVEAREQDLVAQAIFSGCPSVEDAETILKIMVAQRHLKKTVKDQSVYYTLNITPQNKTLLQ